MINDRVPLLLIPLIRPWVSLWAMGRRFFLLNYDTLRKDNQVYRVAKTSPGLFNSFIGSRYTSPKKGQRVFISAHII